MVVPLVAIPPRHERSKSSEYSRPYPKTPDAGIIGFLKSIPEILTDKSAITRLPPLN